MTTTPNSIESEQLATPSTQRRLYRSNSQKVLAGVCGGLGEYFSVDPVWFRIGFVLLALGGGSGVVIYLLSWLIVRPQPDGIRAHRRRAEADANDLERAIGRLELKPPVWLFSSGPVGDPPKPEEEPVDVSEIRVPPTHGSTPFSSGRSTSRSLASGRRRY